MLPRIITILSFLLFSASSLEAQSYDEKDFRLYITKDGLSNNDVWSIAQDSYGYLWIATKKGLNRFDGNSFQQFYADTSRNSLPQDWVYKLKLLGSEQLAAITLNGSLHFINTRTLTSHNLIIPPDSLKLPGVVNKVRDVLEDKEGHIFILTSTGFYEFNNKEELVFRHDHYSRKYLETNQGSFGNNMIMVNDHTILISSGEGLYVYRIAEKDFHTAGDKDEIFFRQIISPGKKFWFTHADTNSISLQIREENKFLWIDLLHKVTKTIVVPPNFIKKFDRVSQLVRLNDTTFAINAGIGFYCIHYNRTNDSLNLLPVDYFENYFCSKLFVDRNSRLLIATDKGLFRQKRSAVQVEQRSILPQVSSFKGGAQILTMASANNRIFAGTFDEDLLVFDSDSLNLLQRIDFSRYRAPKGLKLVDKIRAIGEDTLLIGPLGCWVNTKNLTSGYLALPALDSHRSVTAIFQDSRKHIYMSSNMTDNLFFRGNDKKFTIINYADSKFSNIQTPMHMAEDPDRNIWFGNEGLVRFNYQSKQFDIILDSFPSFKVPSKTVFCDPVFDKQRNIYFGVHENGLIIYNLTTKRYSQLTRSDGLPDNDISALYLHNNKLWIGTEGGLANYDLSTKKLFSFGVADGMPPQGFTSNCFCYDSVHQLLYCGFDNIIVRFNPDQLTKSSSPPLFFIENVSIEAGNIFYHPGEKIRLSYKNNNVVVNLGAINFEDASQQRFAYRFVKDGSESWQETGSQRSIIFSNLSPGKHRLQVKVYTRNNSWPEQVKEIMITVRPPFWKTTWFVLMTAACTIAGLYILYRFRIKNIQQRANIDKQLAELEMKGLHAQMNPHFIFNSLNSIKEMILEDEKQNASRYLSKFAQLIRTNLEQSRQTFVTVRQSIDHLHKYLEMEKIRFESFSYSIEMDDELTIDEIQMAPMLIQPLVENAIWHGLQNKEGDKKLVIRFYRSNKQLVCEIEDNGVGINRSRENKAGLRPAHRSLGISNIHERIRVLNEKYKMNCSLVISDKSELPGQNESGTIVILRSNI